MLTKRRRQRAQALASELGDCLKMYFNHESFNYDSDGRPVLKTGDIEEVARRILLKHSPSSLEEPKPVPIITILETIARETELDLRFKPLKKIEGGTVRGFISPERKRLFIERQLLVDDHPTLAFVAAHELGHWILHRHKKLKLGGIDEIKKRLIESDESLRFRRKKELSSTRDWIEWQANKFAESLILPKETFKDALIWVQYKKLELAKGFGTVYTNSKRDYDRTVSELAFIYKVSYTNINIRLRNLKLFGDDGYKD